MGDARYCSATLELGLIVGVEVAGESFVGDSDRARSAYRVININPFL